MEDLICLLATVRTLNGSIIYPIWKSIIVVNLPLKVFRVPVSNADIIKSLKSLHTLENISKIKLKSKWESSSYVCAKILYLGKMVNISDKSFANA